MLRSIVLGWILILRVKVSKETVVLRRWGNKVICLYQLSWKCKFATVTCWKADVSSVSVSPSSERKTKTSLRWPIYTFNLVDITKLPWILIYRIWSIDRYLKRPLAVPMETPRWRQTWINCAMIQKYGPHCCTAVGSASGYCSFLLQ